MAKTVKKTMGNEVVNPIELTGNKELDNMLAIIEEARKKGGKSVVVFTTNSKHHKSNTNDKGFGVNDLKPRFLKAYEYLLCNFGVKTKLISMENMSVEWIVKLK